MEALGGAGKRWEVLGDAAKRWRLQGSYKALFASARLLLYEQPPAQKKANHRLHGLAVAELAKLVNSPAALGAEPSALRLIERLLRPFGDGNVGCKLTGPLLSSGSQATVGAISTHDTRSSIDLIANIVLIVSSRMLRNTQSCWFNHVSFLAACGLG